MFDHKMLPTTKEYLDSFASKVFDPIFKGQKLAIHAVQNSGTSSVIQYLLDCPEMVSEEFARKINNFIFISVDLRAVETYEQFWHLVDQSHQSLYGEGITKAQLLRADKPVYFILKYAEELTREDSELYGEITSLHSEDASLMKFLLIFLEEEEDNSYEKIKSDLGMHKDIYVPFRSDDDMRVMLEKEEIWYEYKLDEESKERIIKLSGGFSTVARGLLVLRNSTTAEQFLTLTDEELVNEELIQRRLGKAYQSLNESSQNSLKPYVLKQRVTVDSEYAHKTGIINEAGDFFSPLFEIYLRDVMFADEPFKRVGKKISRWGVDIKEILGNQERLIFQLLFETKGEVVNRESIAKTIWGEKWSESYSDWAIDQAIYSIRSKLQLSKSQLKAVKGKGFVLKV